MSKIKILVISALIIVLSSSISSASTLNLGSETYRFKGTNFHSSEGDYIQLNFGYGIDKYRGYGAELTVGNQKGIMGLEYQFIPEGMQKRDKKFNYAFKLGGITGSLFDDSSSGLKTGFIIEKKLERKEIYFDVDLVSGSEIMIDSELGICGELANGITGVLGYKVIGSETNTLSGVNYGVKIDF
ncbi:hypothetical protein JCM16358_00580 [Halanaerocella petrolearia]